MSITVRLAGRSDVDALVALNFLLQDLHVTNRPRDFRLADPKTVAEWFGTMFLDSAARVWIAECDGFAAGYAVTACRELPGNPFCLPRRLCEIDQIVVSPDLRRKGVARAIIQTVLSDARDHEIADVELTSWAFNREAHEAFRSLGFSEYRKRFGRTIS